MSRTVTALYDTRQEAERALQALRAEVSLAHAEIYDGTPERASALRDVELTPEERASCEQKMASGDHMLLAQVRTGEDPGHIIEVLERVASEGPGQAAYGAREDFAGGDRAGEHHANEHHDRAGVIEEERIPVVEEELRVGTREVVRGGARVRTQVEEVPVQQDVELIEEHARVERRPATRLIAESELEAGGLLRERVIEVAQMREEAVVTKQAFVREEVVVSKSIERRVERIDDSVRRTEVEVDRLEGERPAFSGIADDRSDRTR
jgi:stress response protein YsnF